MVDGMILVIIKFKERGTGLIVKLLLKQQNKREKVNIYLQVENGGSATSGTCLV